MRLDNLETKKEKIINDILKQQVNLINVIRFNYSNVKIRLSLDELKIIDEVINLVNPTSIKDLGKVMKEITPRVKNRCDMSKLNSILREKIN